MNSDKFEKIKSALPSIAEAVKQFPDSLQAKVFDLLINELLGEQTVVAPGAQNESASEPGETPPQAVTNKPSRGKNKKRAEVYSIDRHLNLRGDGNTISSFKEFYEQKQPNSATEFNAVAIYYLQRLLALDAVTLDHVYTCYKEVGKKPPEAFRQSFYDTQNRNGYIELTDQGILSIPHRGIVFVEHDLPKPKSSKKSDSR